MICNKCGRPNETGNAFCQYCGAPLSAGAPDRTATGPSIPVSRVQLPRKKANIPAVIMSAVSVLLAVIIVLMACGVTEAVFSGSKSFAEPEDAIKYFFERVKAGDFEGALSVCAVNEISSKYDFGALLERLKALTPSMQYLPTEYKLYSAFDKASVKSQIMRQLSYMALSAVLPDKYANYLNGTVITGKDFDFGSVVDDMNPKDFMSLEVADIGQNSRAKDSSYKDNMRKQAKVYGADEITARDVLYKIDGEYYAGGVMLVRYGGGWMIGQLNDPLINQSVTGALIPLDNKSDFDDIISSGEAPQVSMAPAATVAAPSTAPSVATEAPAPTVSVPKLYNFAIVYGGIHPFFDPWRFGSQQAAMDLRIPTPNVTSPQDWDQTQQNAIIDGLIAGGVNGIGMFTSDAVAGNEKIGELVDMGIPVVTMGDSPATPSKATFCYATDFGASAAYATQALIDKLKAGGKTKGNIVHFCSGLANSHTQKIIAAINEVLAKPENAGFILYKHIPDTDNFQSAEKAISAMFSSYYMEVDGILCTGYINSQVLAKTMNERKKNDGIVVIGADDSPDVMTAVSNGYMYGTMTQSSWAMGYVGTFGLKLLTDGYTYKENAPFLINSGFWLCTKDNIKDYDFRQQNIATDFVSTMVDGFFDAPGTVKKPFDTSSLPVTDSLGFVGPAYELGQ